jgi:pantetheine-phosphate adenylyltransferase
MKVIYPGSFDPITLGHINIIKRATKLFDEVIVCISNNFNKKYTFDSKTRYSLLKKTLSEAGMHNIEIIESDDLIVRECEKRGAVAIVRGIRNFNDLSLEMQLSQINRRLSNNNVDTLFMTADENFVNISSTQIREIALYGGNVDDMVTPSVKEALLSLNANGKTHTKK